MSLRFDLNGDDWLYKDFVGMDWIWRDSEKPHTQDVRWWRKGTVPGTVYEDLLRNHEIPDPYFERNSLLVEWVPARTWIYRKTFRADAAWKDQRIQLHFKGIDYEAAVYVNGKLAGRHKGMYIPAVFEVSGLLDYEGENVLAVVIEPAPHEMPQVSKTELVHTHKSRMTYWWDFCPRMIHIGIWDEVYLDITGPVRIEDVFVRPELHEAYTRADLSIHVRLNSEADVHTAVQVHTDILLDGEKLAECDSNIQLLRGDSTVSQTVALDRPKLWWPNGYGEQPLYEAKVTVTGVSGGAAAERSVSSGRSITFGIRDVEMIGNDTEDETALAYTFRVNGQTMYIKGWNWVPMDVMYGVERPEKLERLLTLARRANVNMLRVWGGGLIEKDAFYELCSRYGIMVWQEFIQSSSGIANKPSEAAGFVDMMVREAEQIIPRKRNHASLVLWCGGNELQADDGAPLDNREPVLKALQEVVGRLDPDRFWLPTSPTGRLFLNSMDNIRKDPLGLHDVHGPWEHQGLTEHYTLYNSGTSLLHSEFGVEGMTNLNVLDRTIAQANQWPANKDNPVYFHRGAWWINEPLVQSCFEGISELDTLVEASQFLQYEGLRYAVESNRRRKYQNSGTLPWQFNEPFPNAYCTSALDYFADPKPVYYGVAAAYERIHASASFPMQAWAGQKEFMADVWASSSDVGSMEDAAVEISLAGLGGVVYLHRSLKDIRIEGNRSTFVTSIRYPLDELDDPVFFLDIKIIDSRGKQLSHNRYLHSAAKTLKPMLEAAGTQLDVSARKREDRWALSLTNKGSFAALNVRIEDSRGLDQREGFVYFTGNYMTLLPNETVTVYADWSGVPLLDRSIEVSGWNIDKQIVK